MLPTGAAAVPLLGPPPRGPSLMRRRPNPRIELVPEPEPEPDPEPQPEPTSLLTEREQEDRDEIESDQFIQAPPHGSGWAIG